MVRFITRIQLHAAKEKDYALLQQEMEKESFAIVNNYTRIKSAAGNSKEYKRDGETLKDINDAVFRAVRKAGNNKYAFTVRKEKRI